MFFFPRLLRYFFYLLSHICQIIFYRGCGGVISLSANEEAKISSSNYPNKYSLGEECVWLVKVSFYSIKSTNVKDSQSAYCRIVALSEDCRIVALFADRG